VELGPTSCGFQMKENDISIKVRYKWDPTYNPSGRHMLFGVVGEEDVYV
jgi:hypothetical protein